MNFDESKMVNKKEIIDKMYELGNGSVYKKDLRIMVDLYGKAIVSLLAEGKIVKCRNMGTFYLKRYENRKGRNPATGEIFPIEPYHRPMLKFPDKVYTKFKLMERNMDTLSLRKKRFRLQKIMVLLVMKQNGLNH